LNSPAKSSIGSGQVGLGAHQQNKLALFSDNLDKKIIYPYLCMNTFVEEGVGTGIW